MKTRFLPACISICAITLAPFYFQSALAAGDSGYQMFKWTDDKGEVHFGDSIPAKYLNKQHDIINAQGQTIKDVKAAPTPEQLAEKKRLARIAEEKEKAQEASAAKQQRMDRMLMDTYTTERDLTAARDARIDAVNSQIRLSESIIKDSQGKLAELQKRAARIKKGHGKIPKYLAENISSNQDQIATQEDAKKSREEQRAQIKSQFDTYIKRFRVLKAQQEKDRQALEDQN